VVSTSGQSVTTAADGVYVFTLPPGTYSVAVSKSGYQANQVARTVAAGATTWGSVGLASNSMADTQAPQVAITFPSNEAALDLGRIDLKGTASDNSGAVASVKVSVNGGATTTVPVTNGAFVIEVQLSPGTNTLTVTATDAANNTGTATTRAVFNAGVAGFVHLASDEAQRIDGATIELREASSGTVVSTVTSDASGAYFAPVMTVPADYLVVAKKTGYLTLSQTVSVPADARLALNIGLTEGVDEIAEAQVTFVEPADGSTVTTDTVTVYGVVKGFDVAGVVVNDVTAELLGAGGFSVTLPMTEGENVIIATATGTTGQTVSARLTLNRKLVMGATDASMVKGGCGGCSTGFGFEALGLLAVASLARRRRSGPDAVLRCRCPIGSSRCPGR